MQTLLRRTRHFLHNAPAPHNYSPSRILSTTTPKPASPTPAKTDTAARPLAASSTSLPHFLGYAGALPFLSGGLLATLAPASIAAPATQLYGASILSFLGGVHWGVALRSSEGSSRADYAYGVVPSLVGWGCAVVPPEVGLPALSVSFAAAFAYDGFRFRDGSGIPTWYRRLRLPLSIAAIGGCALAGQAVRRERTKMGDGMCLRESDAVVVSTSAYEGPVGTDHNQGE